jgi:hypothetical protein
MKKLLLMMAMIVLTGMAGFTQSFEKGNQGINLGIGLGNGYYGAGYSFAFGVNGSYEYAIVEVPMGSKLTGVVGVGGLAGVSFSTFAYNYWSDGSYHYTNYIIAARGTFHFIFNDKFDPYAGITLGYQGSSWKWKGSGSEPPEYSSNSGYFRGGFFVGARYFFTDNFGVYAELGYMLNFLNMGITFKID